MHHINTTTKIVYTITFPLEKKQLTMLRFSEKMLNFAPSLRKE